MNSFLVVQSLSGVKLIDGNEIAIELGYACKDPAESQNQGSQ